MATRRRPGQRNDPRNPSSAYSHPAGYTESSDLLTDSSKVVSVASPDWPLAAADAMVKGVQGIVAGQQASDQVLASLDQAWS